MSDQNILKSIEKASHVIGKTWPLYSFVTSNPLSGYENLPFDEALNQAKENLKTRVFPKAKVFKEAWEKGDIKAKELKKLLQEKGFENSPESYLETMELEKTVFDFNENQELDRIMTKWLSAFMDEGLADWELPGKEKGFYKAWRELAVYDSQLKIKSIKDIPENSLEALSVALKDYSDDDFTLLFSDHLAALPGWVGYINYRQESGSAWQEEYPIDLQEYLAVRLWIAQHLDLPFLKRSSSNREKARLDELKYIWLKAWESSWQKELIQILDEESISSVAASKDTPYAEAQLVFCIDTRSELIRRHVESKGNYETYGYAGFFGIAMDYTNLEDGLSRKSCPPIVPSAYRVSEKAIVGKEEIKKSHAKRNQNLKFGQFLLKRMKNMLPSAFGFVEGSGIFYAISLLARTLAPSKANQIQANTQTNHEDFCEPQIKSSHSEENTILNISLGEKVAIVKSAFDLMGWEKFAPLVVFVGHGSQTANNPFGSSLDCGACAASPGRHNARMLAQLANLPEVRESLATNFDISIPHDTLFIGAEHNTTTDKISLFMAGVSELQHGKIKKLELNLDLAQITASQERLGVISNSVSLSEHKASNWGETRPEWGLAKNAGFIVGPREMSKNQHLGGRCFLHSYNWEKDQTGAFLEGIMQGPMVVTQWINNHYYFSSIDNNKFGGGTKITHNITGKFGVVQGNGGDLKMGLPLQSLNETDSKIYHQPLRLSVLIKAPLSRVNDILERNENLKNLLDNEWIYLMVKDPLESNKIKKYSGNLKWTGIKETKEEHINLDKGILKPVLEETVPV